MTRSRWWVAAAALAAVGAGAAMAGVPSLQDSFDHPEHEKLFPSCETCHSGAIDPGTPMWPAPSSCTTCHDGEVEEIVDWAPPDQPRRSNLRFRHDEHASVLLSAEDPAVTCVECHADRDAAWMTVRVASVPQCLSCHGVTAEHFAAPDSSCAQCHFRLAEATRLTREDIAEFTIPPSHKAPGFAERDGHGELARPLADAPVPVAASCATCHARDFCAVCHVDAPEQPTIQALGIDARSLVHVAVLEAPDDHTIHDFLRQHGVTAVTNVLDCAACHTRESCVTCHISTPDVADDLYAAGAGRGEGAAVERTPPASHDFGFRNLHGPDAAAAPATCAGCHARQNCLDCHRPTAANGQGGYHREGFLVTHPAAAYARETSCSDCHNTRSFCADCHVSAGLTANGPLGSGYHDAKQAFIVGHGQTARQNLESCVSCHTERDCLACHSAVRGRRFNPHGPGFDAERLARKNPEMCLACHRSVPMLP